MSSPANPHPAPGLAYAHTGRILCCDFDGTLAREGAWPGIGAPRHDIIASLQIAVSQLGYYLIINSCRQTIDYEPIKQFCDDNDVPYAQISLGVKPIADVYLDDKGWLPSPAELLRVLERRCYPTVSSYHQAIARGKLISALGREVQQVPENPTPPPDYLSHLTTELRPEQYRVVLPLSGGMETTTLYQLAKEAGLPAQYYYIDTATPYTEHELRAIWRLVGERVAVPRIQLPFSFTQHDHILLGRNAIILLELARQGREAGWWGALWFGVLAGESPVTGGDKSKRFLHQLAPALLVDGFTLTTPLIGWDKSDEVRYWAAGVPGRDLDALRQTKSCFSGDAWACGHCQACFRKYVAFADVLGRAEADSLFPDGYDWAPHAAKYRPLLQQVVASGDYRHYSPARAQSTLRVLTQLGLA